MNIQGTDYLFPLERVLPANVGTGYYIDKEGQVYSTRGSKGRLARLAGSKPYSYSNRYYTVGGKTYSQPDLIARAKANSTFVLETTPQTTPIKTAAFPGVTKPAPVAQGADLKSRIQAAMRNPTTETVSHATTVDEAIKARGSIIAAVTLDGKFQFSPNPVIYTSNTALNAEMEKLAKNNPGVRFVRFTITGVVSAEVKPTLNWS